MKSIKFYTYIFPLAILSGFLLSSCNKENDNPELGANYTLAAGDFSQEFHVFSIEWSQDNIKWLVDDQTFFTTSSPDVGSDNYPFNADQFFIFNVAVGGNWPGPPDNTTVFPQRMFVDYVRIFQ